MNDFFLEKVSSIHKGMPSVPKCYSKCREIMTGKTCKLSLQHVTVAKVNRLLRGLKSGKSSSFDGLDNFSIKLAADIIDRPLHHIISLSIMQKHFQLNGNLAKSYHFTRKIQD